MLQPDEPPEEKEEIEEDVEDEEFIDEDCEESGERRSRVGFGPTGKTVTLQMLLSGDILTPGEGTMAIEYLGQRFIGDLLPDGKIRSQETDIIFASPSAWAIHCKRIINPEKKSGCGWASVKYRGKKLDAYKNLWFKKKKQERNKENEGSDGVDEDMEKEKMMAPAPTPVHRVVMKHHALGNRSIMHDANTLVESTPFSSIGKIQPFLVSMTTNAVLVMDLHCHLTTSEVVGYLAGHWDVNAHNLAITHAFPCRSRLADRELAPMVEADIYRAIEQRHLTLVGWYHSHPHAAATPTLRDIDAQLDYQIRMKGNSDASYTPCVGVICSPYSPDSTSLESTVVSYWVMPPPESKPNEYSKSMLMNYSVVQDQFLSQDALNEMKRCVDFYKKESDFVNFSDKYKGGTTYLDKLKTTLTSKFPRDQSDGILWSFIRDLVTHGSENGGKPLNLPEIPHTVNTTPTSMDRVNLLVPNIPMPSSVKSNNNSSLLMSSEIASALFASGNFPSASALLGLTSDPSRTSSITSSNSTRTSSNLASLGLSSSNLRDIALSSSNLTNLALSSSNLRDMALSSSNLSSMFISPMSFTMDSLSSLKNMGNNLSALASTSKACDMSSKSKDSTNFATPGSLDKNCTITSRKM